jgi:hypothetical protein
MTRSGPLDIRARFVPRAPGAADRDRAYEGGVTAKGGAVDTTHGSAGRGRQRRAGRRPGAAGRGSAPVGLFLYVSVICVRFNSLYCRTRTNLYFAYRFHPVGWPVSYPGAGAGRRNRVRACPSDGHPPNRPNRPTTTLRCASSTRSRPPRSIGVQAANRSSRPGPAMSSPYPARSPTSGGTGTGRAGSTEPGAGPAAPTSYETGPTGPDPTGPDPPDRAPKPLVRTRRAPARDPPTDPRHPRCRRTASSVRAATAPPLPSAPAARSGSLPRRGWSPR